MPRYGKHHQFSSVQSLSRVQLFATPWIAACQASLSITNSWGSLRFTFIESVMPSSQLILGRPLLLLPPSPPSIRVFSNESTLRMRWPKYCSVVSNSLQTHGLYSPWNSPGQNTGVGSLSLLRGIFPTQLLNPGLLPCRWILYQRSHKGSPRILEWIAYPFSSGSSPPRNWTRVSYIAGGFFTNRAIRKA